jgi:hypothetical protein
LLPRVLDGQQRAGMAHLDLAVLEHRLDLLGQVLKTQQVAHRRPRASHGLRRFRVRQAEFDYQPTQRPRLFERIQVLALDVLDEGHRDGRVIRNLAHDGRHFLKTGQLCGPPAAFAGDDLVAPFAARTRNRANDNRLDDTLRPD